MTQVLQTLPHKSYKRGKSRAFFRSAALSLGFAVDADTHQCAIRCRVPPSFSTTKGDYTVYVLLGLCHENKNAIKQLDAFCLCPNGARQSCTHIAAALFTMQEYAYSAGRVPGKSSRVLSCTEKTQAWGIPKGNANRADLEKDAEHYYRFHQDKLAAKKRKRSKKTAGAGGETGEEQPPQKKSKNSAGIQDIYKIVEQWDIGRDIDLAKASSTFDKLLAENLRAQTKTGKRGKRERRVARHRRPRNK